MSQTIFGALLALIGLGGVIESLIDVVRARRSHEWALVDAEIVESQVECKKGGGHGGGWFAPIVRYRYSWNGEAYVGNRVLFTRLETRSRQDADQFVRQLPLGASIRVRVSPSNPGLSVVQPGVERRTWFYIFAFGSCGLYGLALLAGILK